MYFKFVYMLMGCGLASGAFAQGIENPCGGADALLSLVDRPSAGDSACAVPFKNAILELGFQYQNLPHDEGTLVNLPQAVLRIGLPQTNELAITLPNYNNQSDTTPSGLSPSSLALKHQIGYTEHWLGSVEAVLTLPSGSHIYGNADTGITVNSIVNYSVNSNLSVAFMLGLGSLTDPLSEGGARYTTINPDLVLSYQLNPKLLAYSEFYGQSQTGYGQGSGFDMDLGLLYLLRPNVVFDAEWGQALSGQLGGFNHYVGAGLAVMF